MNTNELCIKIAKEPRSCKVWHYINLATLYPNSAELHLKQLFSLYGVDIPFDIQQWHEGRTFFQLAIMNEGVVC